MPISEEALAKETNRFIAVKGEARVGQALAAFQALKAELWWHLVVNMADGSWAVIRFRDLSAALQANADAAEFRLDHLQDLKPASAVERDSLETKAAQAQARKSPSHVLVVTVNGMPVGILFEGTRRSSGALGLAAPNIDQLGGKYVKLKDYGAILLGTSKK